MIIGDKKKIAFEIKKISDLEHVCQLKLYVNGKNICEWKDSYTRKKYTVQWNLDDLISYLFSTIDFITNDSPFPIKVDGECAEEMDNNARNFESENDEVMDAYYDKLNNWTFLHSWNHASAGAILPDVMFRKVGKEIEISWWTDQDDEGRIFTNKYGFILIPTEEYKELIERLYESYNSLWL